MVADGLPFAIRVGGDQDLVDASGCLLQLRDQLLLAVYDLVVGLVPGIDVDRQSLLRQIHDVPAGRRHDAIVTQPRPEETGLLVRLQDYQLFLICHTSFVL